MSAPRDHNKTAHRGIAWPESYSSLLPVIREQWGIDGEIYLSRQLSGGKSGALVFVADIHSAGFTGQAILKLDRANDSAEQEAHEAELHGRAIEDAPDFAANHLPKLLHALHHGDQFAILSTIAGRGLEYAEPWTDCAFEQQMPAASQLSRELLEDWNPDYRLAEGMHMPQQLLQAWLAHRLDPAAGGRVQRFMLEECGLAAEEPSIVFEGHWYPNPLTFALGLREIPERLRLRAITGHSHGDLHGLNLLVSPASPSRFNYHLIDLADYESGQFLFFDHAYFEFAYLLTARGAATASDWETILARLSRFDSLEEGRLRADELGLIQIVGAMRAEVSEWIERHEADRLSYMENQLLLARVAAGLNFANKQMPAAARQKAFIYAATNLKDYLKLNRLDWPKHGQPFLLQADTPTATNGIQPAPESTPPEMSDTENSGAADPSVSAELSRPRALLAELNRRRVLSVAGLYGIAAWLCIEAVDALEALLGLPSWSDRLATLVLTLGFPVACIVAWKTAGRAAGRQHQTADRSLRDFLVAACVIAIVAVTLGRSIIEDFSADSSLTQSTASRQSIAVLPFRNLSMGAHDDRFSDGLTIEIMGTLARSGEFRIPGQSSAFSYKGRSDDLRSIGEALGVEYILEGSVRRLEDELRVEVQLVHADDGFLVWSDVFVDEVRDIFVVQEKIANAIGSALRKPMGIKAAALQISRTDNPQAYTLFLNGLALLERRGPGVRQAADALVESVTLDPDFAAGWAALSLAYEVYPTFVDNIGEHPRLPATYYRLARDAALKAQALDPTAPIVQHALGNLNRRARQWTLAEDNYRQALAAEPDNHAVMEDYSELLAILGHHSQALAMAERMLQLDPLNPLYLFRIAQIRWLADRSVTSVESMIALFKKHPGFQVMTIRPILGYLFEAGQFERLEALVDDCATCGLFFRDRVLSIMEATRTETPDTVFETFKDDNILGYLFLEVLGGPDLVLKAFRYYARSPEIRTLIFRVPWPVVETVGATAEFKSLMEQDGIADYWRARGWPSRCQPLEGADFECN